MSKSKSILIVDPQVEGHHLTWIRYITRFFLEYHFQVTLMADLRKSCQELVQDAVARDINEVRIISAFDDNGQYWGGGILNSVLKAQEKFSFNHIFINELDLFASSCFRKAAIGFKPPMQLRGVLSGVYFRPRFLLEKRFSFSNKLKSIGFNKLCAEQWFKHIFLLDERRIESIADQFPNVNFHLLPDPWDGDYSTNQNHARELLNLPENTFVFLQFGIGTRRKGLHLVIEAMEKIPESSPIFLLCAGKLSISKQLRQRLESLERQGRARILDRYVSDQEQETCFCAADAVLLPYVQHLGSSGVLSRAAASGKPVIASDFDLIGWRVHHYGLGLLFQDGNIEQLQGALCTFAEMDESELGELKDNALRFAQTCSLDEFRRTLVQPFDLER